MATYTPIVGSVNTTGIPIAVTATATPGTKLHDSHSTSIDEVTVFATNIDTVARLLTLELGGVTAACQLMITLPPQSGEQLIVDAIRVTGGVSIAAFAASANKVNCRVVVNRIT